MAPAVRLAAAVVALLTWPTLARDIARGVAVDNDAADDDLTPDDVDVMDAPTAPVAATQTMRHHHKHRHHHHKKHHHKEEHDADKAPAKAAAPKDGSHAVVISSVKRVAAAGSADEHSLVAKLKDMEGQLAAKEKVDGEKRTSIRVNGPLPEDFNTRFAEAVALATKCKASDVKVIGALPDVDGVVQVIFEAPNRIADETVDEAADADSPLATGPLMNFLIEKGPEEAKEEPKETAKEESVSDEAAHGNRIDVDTSMPYGDLEPFGREDTAQELTEAAVTESNEMVDQLERAEVAEEKRAVFRALTRLRGAAVTSFDGIARAQTGNIDEYNKVNKWRKTHPLHHLAQEESDVSRWAFPNNAD